MMKVHFYKPSFFWFVIAFSIRLISLCVSYFYSLSIGEEGFSPISSIHDDKYYYEAASQILKGEAPELYNAYPYVVAFIFLLAGQNIFIGQLFNVVISAATVFVGVLLARDLFDNKVISYKSIKHPSNIAGILLTVYPFSIFYSTQLLRDSIIVFLGIVDIFFMVRLFKQNKSNKFVCWLLIIVCTSCLYLIRPYAAAFIVSSFVLYYLFFIKRDVVLRLYPLLFVIVFLIAIVPYLAGYGVFGVSYFMTLLQSLAEFRKEVYAIGGSSVGIEFDLDNPVSFLGAYLYSYVTVLLGPFPWQIKSAVHFLALPEAVFFLILFPLWLKLAFTFLRGRMQHEGFLLLFAILMIGGIALFSDNVGANTRLRLLPVTALLILSSGYISKAFTKKYS